MSFPKATSRRACVAAFAVSGEQQQLVLFSKRLTGEKAGLIMPYA
jgi:hypothetical protein